MPVADVEYGVQPVAGVGEAGGVDLARLAADAPLQPELSGDIEGPVLDGEGRQGLKAELHRGDVEGDGQSRRLLALGREARAADHHHLPRGQVVDLQATAQQLGVAPADVEVVGLQPHTLLVGDGQAADGEVAPDVAAQPLHLQPSETAEPEPGGARLDQEPPLRRQQPHARADQGGGHDQDDGDQSEQRPAADGARPPRGEPAPGRRRPQGWLGLGQNAWPMLR